MGAYQLAIRSVKRSNIVARDERILEPGALGPGHAMKALNTCVAGAGPLLSTSGHQAFYANAGVSPAAIRLRRAQRTKIRMTART